MNFEEHVAFRKDLRRLSRKYTSIEDDLETIKKILTIRPYSTSSVGYQLDPPNKEITAIIVCKMASMSSKGAGIRSGLHLVYAWLKHQERILFIGLFHETENEGRVSIIHRRISVSANQGLHGRTLQA